MRVMSVGRLALGCKQLAGAAACTLQRQSNYYDSYGVLGAHTLLG